MTAFTDALDDEGLAYFNSVCDKPFSGQAVAFLNAYWPEVQDQAEFIFTVAWDIIKKADMEGKGVQYVHLYDEGNDLDFDMGLYFYEQLCKFIEADADLEQDAVWTTSDWAPSQPTMMTAVTRKKELREKVDVNFDGRISFLEYLLHQYEEYANPADFVTRSMSGGDEHPEVRAARLALEEVNRAIQAYEAEKMRLTEAAKLPGVKGLQATHQLHQLGASPLAEELNVALITAEAKLRKARRLFGAGGSGGADGDYANTDGAMWWMTRDLEEKKKYYANR